MSRLRTSPRHILASAAAEVGWQWPLRFAVGNILWRHCHQPAAAVLNSGNPDLVVLTLGVELDARSDADIVGDVGGADGVGQRLGISRTGALIGVGGDEQCLEREDVIGAQVDAWVGLGQGRFEHRAQLLVSGRTRE